jgi:filamentous hemagglutinin family protein
MKNYAFRISIRALAAIVSIYAASNACIVSAAPRISIIPTPSTEPGATGTIVTSDQNQTAITVTGGQAAGENLFHSFSRFDVNTGQTADFQAPAGIYNVLARVNGGSPSSIDGMLKLSGGAANLYLMNPSGIIFGKNASLNIPSAFVGTTAISVNLQTLGKDRKTSSPLSHFNAFGDNDYENLTNAPFSVTFLRDKDAARIKISDSFEFSTNNLTTKINLVLLDRKIDSPKNIDAYIPITSNNITLPLSILNARLSTKIKDIPNPPNQNVLSSSIPSSPTQDLSDVQTILMQTTPIGIEQMPSANISTSIYITTVGEGKWPSPISNPNSISMGILKLELKPYQEGVLTHKVTRQVTTAPVFQSN